MSSKFSGACSRAWDSTKHASGLRVQSSMVLGQEPVQKYIRRQGSLSPAGAERFKHVINLCDYTGPHRLFPIKSVILGSRFSGACSGAWDSTKHVLGLGIQLSMLSGLGFNQAWSRDKSWCKITSTARQPGLSPTPAEERLHRPISAATRTSCKEKFDLIRGAS